MIFQANRLEESSRSDAGDRLDRPSRHGPHASAGRSSAPARACIACAGRAPPSPSPEREGSSQQAQPDMFAAQQVKDTRQAKGGRGRKKGNGSGHDMPEPDMVAINDAFERAREHLGIAERLEELLKEQPPAA